MLTPTVKAAFILGCLLPAPTAVAQRANTAAVSGSVYGHAVGRDGQPAIGIGVTARPLDAVLGAILPHTTTDARGDFRLVVPWWDKYTVYADDEDAGYSSYTTGSFGQTVPLTVEITPDHREAGVTLTLPPKAGFLRVKLTNRTTGASIPTMSVSVLRDTAPPALAFTIGCSSTKTLLLPPDDDLLIRISSDGFREWDKGLHLRSGEQITLNVQLDPAH